MTKFRLFRISIQNLSLLLNPSRLVFEIHSGMLDLLITTGSIIDSYKNTFCWRKSFFWNATSQKMLGRAHDIYWTWNNFWRYAPQQTPLKVKTYGKVHNIYQISKKSLHYAPRRHPNQFEAVNLLKKDITLLPDWNEWIIISV